MRSRWHYRVVIVAATALGALTMTGLAGCGKSKMPMAKVHGEVKYDGEPVEKGSIAFHPADGNGPSAGGEIRQGKFSALVPPGMKRVEVRGSKLVGKRKPTPENPVEEDIFQEYIPPVYNIRSNLSQEVKMPETKIDLDLKRVASDARR